MGLTKSKSRFKTVAELIDALGVPAARIRMTPLPGTATERDYLRINEAECLCEFVDGVIVEKAMGFWESRLGIRLGSLLADFVEDHALGIVAGADGPLRLRRGLIREPDISFVSWNQLPGNELPDEAIPDLFPDLAVEVYSEGNRRKEMARKRREYFRAGSQLVWIVYPKTKTIEVYTSPTEFTTLGITDTLDGGELLPGFKVAVRTIFAPPPRPKSRNGKTK